MNMRTMNTLNNLWKLVNAASSVRDMAQQSKTYQFAAKPDTTLYLHLDGVDLHITRWAQPLIRVQTVLQAGFGWRIASEQDDVGVYLVARRRSVVGTVAQGRFEVNLPHDAHLVMKLERCNLHLQGLHGAYELPAHNTSLHVGD